MPLRHDLPPRLGVNIDHVATLRQARGTPYPDPVEAAFIAERAGADQITVHLREDRRHIQDRDLHLLRKTVSTRLNLEMGASDEMLEIALALRPDIVTLVPERREERTTEGGLDVAGQWGRIDTYTRRLRASGAQISLFIDPDAEQIDAAAALAAQIVELHTGDYAEADRAQRQRDPHAGAHPRAKELLRLKIAAQRSHDKGLIVAAGHGLDLKNVVDLAALPHIEEFNIGHSLVANAVFVGFERAVQDMIAAIRLGYSQRASATP
jgi:pyridoxine 5-phosphate synthase